GGGVDAVGGAHQGRNIQNSQVELLAFRHKSPLGFEANPAELEARRQGGTPPVSVVGKNVMTGHSNGTLGQADEEPRAILEGGMAFSSGISEEDRLSKATRVAGQLVKERAWHVQPFVLHDPSIESAQHSVI